MADSEVSVGDPLRSLLKECLEQLGRLEETVLEASFLYLKGEWYNTPDDLKVALQDPPTWDALRLPSRLKLALKQRLQPSVASSSSRPPPLNTDFPTPTSSPTSSNVAQQEAADEVVEWVRCFSPEHREFYFFNERTHETLWHLPDGTKTRDDAWSIELAAQHEVSEGEAEAEAQAEGGRGRGGGEDGSAEGRWGADSTDCHARQNPPPSYSDLVHIPPPPTPSAPHHLLYELQPPTLLAYGSALDALPVAVVVGEVQDGDEAEEGLERIHAFGEEGDEDEDDGLNEEEEEEDDEEEEEEGRGGADVEPSPELVQQLVDMGFKDLLAAQALSSSNNNVSEAAALLLRGSTEGTGPPPPPPLPSPPRNSTEWLAQSRDRLMDAETIRPLPPAKPPGKITRLFQGLLSRQSP